MNLRFPWSPRRRRGGEDARVVDLSTWNDGAGAVTPISRPDSLSPLDHTLPAIDPDVCDARLAVTQVIADLARRGAIDAGTPDVLDYWIDAQLGEWTHLVHAQAADRRRVAARLIAVDVDNLVRESNTLLDMRARMADHEATHAHWRDQLNGHPAATPPPTRPADLTLEVAHALPDPVRLPPAHLSGLLEPGPAALE